jgi:hypothetical protein
VKYLLALFLATQVQAVELKYLGVDFRKYPGKTYFAELPHEQLREEIAVVFDTQIVGCLHWWNRVHGSSTDSQFRWLGWNFLLGCPLHIFGTEIEPLYEHHSQHCLDCERQEHFPVSDGLGFNWTIFGTRVK